MRSRATTKILNLKSSVYELQEAVKALTKPKAKAKAKSKPERTVGS